MKSNMNDTDEGAVLYTPMEEAISSAPIEEGSVDEEAVLSTHIKDGVGRSQ